MNDLISRQWLVECVEEGWIKFDTEKDKNKFIHLVRDTAPSVDVQPVRRGHWIIKDNPGTGWYRVTCSECGEDVTSVAPVIGFFPNARVTWDFCPNCGCSNMESQTDG